MRTSFSRRNLLRGLGATAVLAPFAQNLLKPGRVRAAAPKRAMFVYVPDGCIPSLWHPTGSETDFTLPEMSAPLAAVKQHLVFLDGLEMFAGGATHEGGIAKVLTGVSDQSLDIFLGDKLAGSTPFHSLQLGVGGTFQAGEPGTFSFNGGTRVLPADNPLDVFSRVFGSVQSGGSGGDDIAAKRKKSVLDAALGDLNSLRTKLGNTEKNKLDLHLASLRELESRLSGSGLKACNVAGFNPDGFSINPMDYYPQTHEDEKNFKIVSRLQISLAALALSCGATNVVSLQYSHQVSPTHIPESGSTMANHDASHYGNVGSDTANNWVKIKRWFMGEFVELINTLQKHARRRRHAARQHARDAVLGARRLQPARSQARPLRARRWRGRQAQDGTLPQLRGQ
jgi:hypothetical protein